MKSKTVSVHNQTSWANSVFTFHEEDPVVCRDCTLDLTNLTVTPGHCWLSISCLHDFSKARPKHYWRTHLWTHGRTVLHCTALYCTAYTPPPSTLLPISSSRSQNIAKHQVREERKSDYSRDKVPDINSHLIRKPAEGCWESRVKSRMKCEEIWFALQIITFYPEIWPGSSGWQS